MQLSLLNNKKVSILGGGPVGLTLAVLLQKRGADVTVYERDAGPETRVWGSTLDIHADSGQLALESAGIGAQFRQLARPTGERMANEQGTILLEEAPDETDPYGRPEIDRTDLRRLLLSTLMPGTVVWNHNFQSLEARRGRFDLCFADQPNQVADLVIGANGGRSKLRPYVSSQVPVYSGSFFISGKITAPEQCAEFCTLVGGGNLMVRAQGKALFAHTHADGEIDYGLSFRQPLDWLAQRGLTAQPSALVAQLLTEELASWHPLFHEAFHATPEFAFLPMFGLPLEPKREVTQSITLVGDAAHLMPPYAGIGVNIGMVDALTLANNLTDEHFPNIEAAIRAYERTMYGYAQAAQEETAKSEEAIHSDMTPEELVNTTRGPR